MYRVVKCDCCGFVKPGHDDPYFPTDVVFERNNLLNKIHPAFHCSCKEVCKGSQFYCANRPTHKYWFYQQHPRHPRDLLNLPPGETNATICNDWHNGIGSQNVNGNYFLFCRLVGLCLFTEMLLNFVVSITVPTSPWTILGAVISMTKFSYIWLHPTGCMFMCSASSLSYHCFVFSASFNQWDLKYGRIYSCRNGFGIMPVPPDSPLPMIATLPFSRNFIKSWIPWLPQRNPPKDK